MMLVISHRWSRRFARSGLPPGEKYGRVVAEGTSFRVADHPGRSGLTLPRRPFRATFPFSMIGPLPFSAGRAREGALKDVLLATLSGPSS
jgi:hypothetical protein